MRSAANYADEIGATQRDAILRAQASGFRVVAVDGDQMRVRLSDREHVAEFTAFFCVRGFLVVERSPKELDVHPLNHVSARSDAIQSRATLDQWRLMRPDVMVDELA